MALYLNLDGLQSGVRRIDLTEDAASFGFPSGDAEFAEPLRLALQVTRDGSTVMVSGTIEAHAGLVCDRCLTPFTEVVRADLREIFHLLDGPPPYRPDEDEGIHFINRRAPRVDLAPMVREQVLLELPMKTLCRTDCLGLCPQCGANRNDGPCGCGTEARQSRTGEERR
jgi:uncharacterized protein